MVVSIADDSPTARQSDGASTNDGSGGDLRGASASSSSSNHNTNSTNSNNNNNNNNNSISNSNSSSGVLDATASPVPPPSAAEASGGVALGYHDGEENKEEAHIAMKRDWYTTAATFCAGGAAGAVSRTVTAPLDRIKIIVQEGHLVKSKTVSTLVPRKNPSIVEVARLVHSDSGIKGFWRGNLVNCFKAGPEFAIVFTIRRYCFSVYDDCIEREKERRKGAVARWKAKDEASKAISERERVERESMLGILELDDDPAATTERHGVVSAAETERLSAIERETSIFTAPFNRLICLSQVPRLMVNCGIGAVAGVGAQSVLYPLEVVKTRLVVSKSKEYGGGLTEVVRQAYRSGGIAEFYRGFTPNLVGIIVYRGLEVGIYSSAQQSVMLYRMQALHMSRHDATLSTSEVGGVAMAASVIAQTISYPLNVIRTRLQTQGTNGRQRLYSGMVDCCVKLVRKDGVPVLFSGLVANYLKSVPASGITFMVFERVQQFLVGDD